MRYGARIATVLLLLGAGAAVNACDMYQEGHYTDQKIQVAHEKYVREFAVDGSRNDVLAEIARHYNRYGDDGLYLTVVYNPAAPDATAMKATQSAADMAAWLRQKGGVDQVRTDILPARDTQGLRAIVSYGSVTAEAPDCNVMSGYERREDFGKDIDSYDLGCTVDTVIAKQIARPKDLLGRDFENTHTDARGVVNQVEGARAGEMNKSLGGESTTK